MLVLNTRLSYLCRKFHYHRKDPTNYDKSHRWNQLLLHATGSGRALRLLVWPRSSAAAGPYLCQVQRTTPEILQPLDMELHTMSSTIVLYVSASYDWGLRQSHLKKYHKHLRRNGRKGACSVQALDKASLFLVEISHWNCCYLRLLYHSSILRAYAHVYCLKQTKNLEFTPRGLRCFFKRSMHFPRHVAHQHRI